MSIKEQKHVFESICKKKVHSEKNREVAANKHTVYISKQNAKLNASFGSPCEHGRIRDTLSMIDSENQRSLFCLVM